jgi:hypothetical protein
METCFPPKTLRIFDVHDEIGSPSNPAAAAVISLSWQVLQKSVNAASIHNIGGVWNFPSRWQSAGDDTCLRSVNLQRLGLPGGTAWSRGLR